MADDPAEVVMTDDFLWPSPEMRQRAIDEAVRLLGIDINNKIQDKLRISVDLAVKKVTDEADLKIAELKRKLDESVALVAQANAMIVTLKGINQHDFTKIVDNLIARFDVIEERFGTGNVSGDYKVTHPLKLICELFKDLIMYARNNQVYQQAEYNVSNNDVKDRLMADIHGEMWKYVLGKNLYEIQQISDAASRL